MAYFFMDDWPPPNVCAVVAVAIALVGVTLSALHTWHIAGKKLHLDRRMETGKVFMAVSSGAHGTREGGPQA